MKLTLSPRDLLTLYSHINGYGEIDDTRTVILHQPLARDKEIVIIDDINLSMFISIPRHVDAVKLRKKLFNDYYYRNCIPPPRKKSKYKPTSVAATNDNGSGKYTKGLFSAVEFNTGIHADIKALLKRIDSNDTLHYGEFNQSYYREDASPLPFTDNIFTGLPFDYYEDGNGYYIVDIPSMNGVDSEMRFPGQKQYKLTFTNHLIMYFFITQFQREEKMTFYNDKTTEPFNILLIAYNADDKNILAIKPTLTRFRGRPIEYIEGQLFMFKSSSDGGYPFSFSDVMCIREGLLHPSYIDQSQSRQYDNTFINMRDRNVVVSSLPRSGGGVTFNYQTLYIDLSTLKDYDIKVVDFTSRKQYLLPFTPKKIDKCCLLSLTPPSNPNTPIVTVATTTTTTTTTATVTTKKKKKKRVKGEVLIDNMFTKITPEEYETMKSKQYERPMISVDPSRKKRNEVKGKKRDIPIKNSGPPITTMFNVISKKRDRLDDESDHSSQNKRFKDANNNG